MKQSISKIIRIYKVTTTKCYNKDKQRAVCPLLTIDSVSMDMSDCVDTAGEMLSEFNTGVVGEAGVVTSSDTDETINI